MPDRERNTRAGEIHQTSGAGTMSEKVKFLMTFRARLMLLLASVLLLTIVLVLILDSWTRKVANRIIDEQNKQITEAVNRGYDDLAQANYLAWASLNSEQYLYKIVEPRGLPPSVENIFVTERDGKVVDSTLGEFVDRHIDVPQDEESQVRSEDPVRNATNGSYDHAPKTYYSPITTTRGLYWIVIVTTQQGIINEISDASKNLAERNRMLSNYRLGATAGLLVLGLATLVFICWRVIRPIEKLAQAARRVAAGSLDFHVDIKRNDEIGQLADTFNEMIDGLRSKHELKEKLDQAERVAVIGRLTQSVAHEVRNPLNVINLSIDHVSSKYAPEDEKKREQFTAILSSIKDEIARLKYLVSDLLNYGRPAQLMLRPVDMRDLVDETMTLVRPQADVQGIEIKVSSDAESAEVMGDRERLKSCLSNIVINALQAMPTGGTLTTDIHKNNRMIELQISDTGIGISEEAIRKIFEPYFSTRNSGFGLGLAVTRSIIEDHKGTIEVQSERDKGTTFTVKLPASNNGAAD